MTQPGEVRIRRALLSVSDKTGVVEFARGLAALGVELVSTRLSSGGKHLTLGLRCPAATVGRCTGTTRLSARTRTRAVVGGGEPAASTCRT